MRSGLPTGTVTFLFTDIEGSTQLLQSLGEDYALLLEEHRQLLRDSFQRWHGQEIDTQGDSFFVAFGRASDAIQAAVELQHSLENHSWPQAARVLVRMGLHTGEPSLTDSGYVGMDVHRAARICSAGYGGQVLLSDATQKIVEQALPDGISLRDLGEHRLKDLQRTERIYQIVFSDLPSDFPHLRSLDAQPNNLPAQLTSFIGREREISQVEELLDRSRLVTLTGPGGAGKTRLALQVGADCLEGYPDGVWFVELAPLNKGEFIPKAIASALKVREESQKPLVDTISDSWSSSFFLLIIDNCEHLVASAASLIDILLHRCRNLKILATSREALYIAGEQIFPVPSLSSPGEWRVSQVETLTRYEAVRLFIERALAWQPTFAVTGQNAPALAQICTHLDGIPLAIELAAARVRSLSLDQITDRLNDRFRLLRSSSLTTTPRQQTLEAAIEWSYDLLSDKERILFRRLAVFVGGWTIDFAEKICADEVLGDQEIFELLARLVDKSLVIFTGESVTPRYHFLESIRQYAQDKLAASGEAERIREAHFAVYHQWVRDLEPKIRAIEQMDILGCIESEHDNLRSALSWAFEQNKSEEAADFTAGMIWFWYLRNYLREGTQWATKALTAVQGASIRARAKAHSALGLITWATNDYLLAQKSLSESAELFQVSQDKAGCADALHILGHVMLDQGKHAEARDYLNRSAILFRQMKNRNMLLTLVGDLGLIAYLHLEFDQALQLFQEQLKLARSLDNRDNIASALNHLGDLARYSGDDDQAETFYQESLIIFGEIGALASIGGLKHNLAHIAKNKGDTNMAMQLFKECLSQFQANDDKKGMLECLEGIAETAVGMALPAQAARLLGAAESLRKAWQVQWWPANQIAYEKSLQELRQKLAPPLLEQEWKGGSFLSLEKAVELAQSLG